MTMSAMKSKNANKKRTASALAHLTTKDMADNGRGEVADGIHVKDNLSEPTMGEKLANLNLLDNNKSNSAKDKESSLAVKPPRADSAYVMFKQALHAEDTPLFWIACTLKTRRDAEQLVLVLNSQYNFLLQVIAKSISLLNPSHVVKLLHSLISIIRSRGAVLACAFPWLRCLLIQRTSGIMSQQSSSLVLNSLCKLIESRVSTLQSALQLSSVLDLLYTEIDDEADKYSTTLPFIYEDKDESDEAESDDAMETDADEDNEDVKEFEDGVSDLDSIRFMVNYSCCVQKRWG